MKGYGLFRRETSRALLRRAYLWLLLPFVAIFALVVRVLTQVYERYPSDGADLPGIFFVLTIAALPLYIVVGRIVANFIQDRHARSKETAA
jgi:hypothetical protein